MSTACILQLSRRRDTSIPMATRQLSSVMIGSSWAKSFASASRGGGRCTAASVTVGSKHIPTTYSRHLTTTRHVRAMGTSTTTTTESSSLPLVYESPLGNVVSKLRTVSLATAIIGSTGVPCMIALKGAVPEVGMLAIAMMFVTGSIGSTAAIHFVFSPYVYRIEVLPVRQCSYKGDNVNEANVNDASVATEDGAQKSNASHTTQAATASGSSAVPPVKDVLLRAWTRSLFLRHYEIVFDPELDVVPYSGMRPLCNFIAKGMPLYVHPEYVYDAKLRKAMNLSVKGFVAPEKSNPDDDLL